MSMVLAESHSQRVQANLPVDGEGFLVERRGWNRDLAQEMAVRLGVGPLDETQWLIIDFIRDRYFRLGALPPMRNVCRKLGVNRDAMKSSFGSCRQLWQVAGLPNPGDEVLSYMG
jgi:tRNA 2-thiouridine synthesizing protein E